MTFERRYELASLGKTGGPSGRRPRRPPIAEAPSRASYYLELIVLLLLIGYSEEQIVKFPRYLVDIEQSKVASQSRMPLVR